MKAGGYLYYIPGIHTKEMVINIAKAHLEKCRPDLARIVGLIDRFTVFSVFEICRLANLDAITQEKKLSPELDKILGELKLLGYNV